MGKLSRTKGAAGEREFCKLLSAELEYLGVDASLSRNLQQARDGGYDIDGLDMLAIEIKRAKKPDIRAWWCQCVLQSYESDRTPVLAYRLDNQKWRVRMHINDIANLDVSVNANDSLEFTVEMDLSLFAQLVADRLLKRDGKAA